MSLQLRIEEETKQNKTKEQFKNPAHTETKFR